MIWVHEELGQFFKSLKATKSAAAKGSKRHALQTQHRSLAGKKTAEMKSLYATALRAAPTYHRERRVYLWGLLRHHLSLFSEWPGLMAPKLPHLVRLLSLCRFEARWLVRHQSNIPQKKADQAAIGEWREGSKQIPRQGRIRGRIWRSIV